jgi:hypothetical protein
MSPKLVPGEHPVPLAACRGPVGRLFKRFGRVQCECGSADPLIAKEVLSCTRSDNKNPFLRILEPSDGLEPSTPSL